MAAVVNALVMALRLELGLLLGLQEVLGLAGNQMLSQT